MYFDAHSDIWSDVTQKRLLGETNIFDRYHLPKFIKGKVEGSVFVIWVDPPYDADYQKRTKEIMDAAAAEISECNNFCIVHNYDEMIQAKNDGKIYIFIGVEGMAYANGDIAAIDEYYNFGVRECMLTWNECNKFGSGASSGFSSGLTEAGINAVERMQELGMILDVSHLNEAGFWDIIDHARTPVIASHSNSSALCAHARNLTDDQLRAIAKSGGVVGLNAYNQFIHADPRKSNVDCLAEHAIHMIDKMGIEGVGCGFDFVDYVDDGECYGDNGNFTQGLRNCTEISNLFDALKKKGLSDDALDKIAFANFHRVIKEVLK